MKRFPWHLRILLLFLTLPCRAAFCSDAGGGTVYRISGVVLSSRDGAPVAHCRLSADLVSSPTNSAGTRTDRASQQPGPGGARRAPGLQRGPGLRGQTNTSSPGGQEFALTDAHGSFSLVVSHAGMWRLTAAARGFRSQAYEEHDGYSSAVSLTAAAPEMSLSFRINPDSVIAGIVFDEAGEPIRQAQVTAEILAANEPGRAPVTQPAGFSQTDDRGRYELAGLPAGDYRVSVHAQPWYAGGTNSNASSPDPSLDVVYAATWFPAAVDAASAEAIHLKPGEEREADVHLTPMPAVHLRIPRNDTGNTGNDVPRGSRPPMITSVSTFGSFLSQPQVTTSATEWDVGGLAPGSYQVRVPGAQGETASVVQLKIGPGSAGVIGLEGAAAPVKLSISIEGVPDHTVERVILTDVDTGQTYVANARRRGRGAGLQGGGDGDDDDAADAPRSVLIPPRRYELAITGSDGVFLTGMQATGAQVTGRMIDVTGGAPSVVLHAATGRAEVTGIVSQAARPAPVMMVLLVPSTFGQANNLIDISRDQSNTDGSFVMQGVIPGQYILVAIDHGWEVNWRDPSTLARYLASGTPMLVRSSAHLHQEVEATAP